MTLPALSASGFRGHLRQPEQTLGLQLKLGARAIDWTALDNWLRDKLMLSLQPYPPGAPCAPAHTPAHAVCELLWRILQVAAALQRAARIPVFEPGRILAWQADQTRPGVWLCEVGVAHVDYVPVQSMRLAYDAAAVLVLGVAGEPASFAAVEPLYQQLETKVLQPLRAVMPVGKSVLPLLACAHECGIPWRHLGLGIFQLGWGAHRLCIQHSKVATDSALGVAVSQDKRVAAEWLRRAGLPTSKHQLVASEAQALAAQVALGWPLVVKPADRDRGEGVTVDILDKTELFAAFHQARALSSQVLVERQVSGVCHRLLVVRDEVLYTVKRWPIAVQGDGRRTISELIAAVNVTQMALPSWKREPLYPTDALAVACLQQAGFSLDSVPLLGVWAALRRIESTEWGGLDEDYSATLHPDNAAIARQAAALFCLDVAGIDIISPDITRPWHENGAVINEVNSAPVLGQSLSSLRAMPQLLQRLLVARGRIAIEAFVGTAKAMEMARQRQQAFQEQGIACYVTSHNFTLNAAGQVLPMALEGLFARCTALLANKSVAALVLVVQTDESLYSGLPADTLDRVVPSGEQLFACSQGNSPARVPADAVVAFLKSLGGENQVSTIEPCSTHPFKR